MYASLQNFFQDFVKCTVSPTQSLSLSVTVQTCRITSGQSNITNILWKYMYWNSYYAFIVLHH